MQNPLPLERKHHEALQKAGPETALLSPRTLFGFALAKCCKLISKRMKMYGPKILLNKAYAI